MSKPSAHLGFQLQEELSILSPGARNVGQAAVEGLPDLLTTKRSGGWATCPGMVLDEVFRILSDYQWGPVAGL